MVEKTIELTEEQLEKVETLEANNISVGEAIDMLFKIKEDIELNAPTEDDIDLLSKLITSVKSSEKEKIVEKEYTESKTYDDQIQKVKRNISWSRDFFNF
ncbi:hypothetical protein [Methanobrevibacter sp.]|uniref:hypothetical protein n=1 Tax=Methanobrevibacter sp. TaxID=66852 RepID=UPI0038638A05